MGLVILTAILYWVINSVLPGIGAEVPLWLSFSQSQLIGLASFLGGLGLGAFGVANATIQTPSTPPLATEKPDEPTIRDVLTVMAQMQNQINEVRERNSSPQTPQP